METNKNQSQGKQSTARTDAVYNSDSESLRNSATTSQSTATSHGTIGAGGGTSEEGNPGNTHTAGSWSGTPEARSQSWIVDEEDDQKRMRG